MFTVTPYETRKNFPPPSDGPYRAAPKLLSLHNLLLAFRPESDASAEHYGIVLWHALSELRSESRPSVAHKDADWCRNLPQVL
jgi:hypothetical protein|tara:strand:- start:207 stop:455 length:249 start_codon:yes stop_codon:yes gene_type:complete